MERIIRFGLIALNLTVAIMSILIHSCRLISILYLKGYMSNISSHDFFRYQKAIGFLSVFFGILRFRRVNISTALKYDRVH